MAMNSMVPIEFEQKLFLLTDWPEKALIFDLTNFADTHQRFALEIADILVARIANPTTHAALKMPLFYLLDSIMKSVGGVYIKLFAAHIVPVFQRVFDELHDLDKARLDFLLSTWERRGLLAHDTLHFLRMHIGDRIVNVLRGPPIAQRPAPISSHLTPNIAPQLASHINLGSKVAPVIDPMLNKRALISSSRPSRSDAAEKRQRMSVDTEVVQQSSGYPSGVDSVGLAGKHQSAPPAMLNEEDSNNHILTAYIAESVVALDSVRAWALSDRLKAFGIEKQHTRLGRVANLVLDGLTESLMLFAPGADSGAPSNGAAPLSKSSANGTSNHLLGAEYQLPAILFHGALPPAPIPGLRPQQIGDAPVQDIVKIISPKFSAEEVVSRKPAQALKALYGEGMLICKQDGLRFRSQAELARHIDTLFKKQAAERTEKRLEHREWYCRSHDWIAEGVPVTATADSDLTSSKTEGFVDNEEFVISFDENFNRCPVSRESFETFWDDDEGGLMFRNAVKVLLNESTDRALFALSKPTLSQDIRYCIVHKLLVVDGWIAEGKACALSEFFGSNRDAFIEAAGEDDENDVFVVTQTVVKS